MTNFQSNLVWQQAKQETIIYEYLRNSVAMRSPQEVIKEFRYLFLELLHSNKEVRRALETIVFAKHKEKIFFKILNYCCYILIDYWSQKTINYSYTLELIELFEPKNFPQIRCHDRRRHKLNLLVKNFNQTEEYRKLKLIVLFLNTGSEIKLEKQCFIRDLLPHYYYLYSAILLGTESLPETTNLILNLKEKRQKLFESQLAKHIIYRSRLVQIARAKQLSNRAGKIIKRVENPTFLGEKNLKKTLKQYLNKVSKTGTIYQTAQEFLINNNLSTSYKEFKQNLYQYLILGIERPVNNQYLLAQKLHQVINEVSYQADSEPCSNQLIFQTCQRLLSFFVIDTSLQNSHYQLIELVMNLGTTQTTALLIKIILISPQAKLDLEQRLGLLFNSYESHNIESGKWLIKLLENVLIAFSLYFGEVNLFMTKIK